MIFTHTGDVSKDSHLEPSIIVTPTERPLKGTVMLEGAKNAALVSIASTLLAQGTSTLHRIPPTVDIFAMFHILEVLGAQVTYDESSRTVNIHTDGVRGDIPLPTHIMSKLRASTLVLGPLLARYGIAHLALPGGDAIGKRPIDYHIKAFQSMGAIIHIQGDMIIASAPKGLSPVRHILEYPSVGATENIMMAAACIHGTTTIINAALEPEVFDLGEIFQGMGATITYETPGTIHITGNLTLSPITHSIMYDRIEAGTFLIAAAITKGEVSLPQAPARHMLVFLDKLRDMGHTVLEGHGGVGVTLIAHPEPHATSIRTMPFPGFPTDLQAPMAVALAAAAGTSMLHETVYEARLGYIKELQRLGAQVVVQNENVALIQGGTPLHGTHVIGGDIRATAALALAGLIAHGTTHIQGVHHILRGYVRFVDKMNALGASLHIAASSSSASHSASIS